MPFEHILAPTDFGPCSARAIDLATTLAQALGARLTLLHAWEVPLYPYTRVAVPMESLVVDIEQHAAEHLACELQKLRERLPIATSSLKLDTPWRAIVEAARSLNADLVVMGTHGRRGIHRALMGSVAEKVVRLCDVPVLTVPSSDAALVL